MEHDLFETIKKIPAANPDLTERERIVRFVGKMIAGTLVTIVLLMTTCTMHSNTFDSARLAEEVKIKEIESNVSISIQETKRQRDEKMRQLIESGKNPLAVRCAFAPSSTRSDREECAQLGIILGSQQKVDVQQ